jgi:hypothetical protein
MKRNGTNRLIENSRHIDLASGIAAEAMAKLRAEFDKLSPEQIGAMLSNTDVVSAAASHLLSFIDSERFTTDTAATDGNSQVETGGADCAITLASVKLALEAGNRKQAVKLRRTLDSCTNTTLWTDAFKDRRGTEKTKRTAFNRWQAARPNTPKWADQLMRSRLLKA